MLGKPPALLSCAGEAREVAIDELDWTWRMLADPIFRFVTFIYTMLQRTEIIATLILMETALHRDIIIISIKNEMK